MSDRPQLVVLFKIVPKSRLFSSVVPESQQALGCSDSVLNELPLINSSTAVLLAGKTGGDLNRSDRQAGCASCSYRTTGIQATIHKRAYVLAIYCFSFCFIWWWARSYVYRAYYWKRLSFATLTKPTWYNDQLRACAYPAGDPRAYSGLRSSTPPAQRRNSRTALSADAIREGLYEHEDSLTIRVCFVLFDVIQVGQVPNVGFRVANMYVMAWVREMSYLLGLGQPCMCVQCACLDARPLQFTCFVQGLKFMMGTCECRIVTPDI